MYKKYSVALGAALAIGVAGMAGGAMAKVEGDTIILGSAISLSGKYSTNGLHTQKGYDFAVERINEAGGVKVGGKTYKLAIKYYDDESAANRATQLAERLIQQDGIEFMLGPYSTGMTKAVAPVTEKFKVPMVEAEGASRALFTQGYKYMFAVLSTSEYYLAPVLDLVAERAKSEGKNPSDLRIGMAFENDGFSLDVRAGVVDVAKKKHGMNIVIDDKLPADLSDMSATLTKFKALKPDILLVSGHSKGAATAARQIEEMKIEAPVISMTHCEAAKVQEKFPKAADGVLCPTQWLSNLPNSEPIFGNASKYNDDFRAAFPEYKVIPYQTTQASAAVLVFKDAFERANSFDRDAVRDALAATDMDTFYGPIRFAPEGNNIAKPMFYRQIDGSGKYNNVVNPGDMVFPRKANY